MPRPFLPARGALAFFAVFFSAQFAQASLVFHRDGGDAKVDVSRRAFASTASRTVRWEQLELSEARGELAWVVQIPAGGSIEPAHPRWFFALDGTTAPVIAPARIPECPAPSVRTSTATFRDEPPARAIDRVLGVSKAGVAITTLKTAGFLVDATAEASLRAADVTGTEVAILILKPGPIGTTETIRIFGPAGEPFPAQLSSSTARIHSFVLSAGRTKLLEKPVAEPAWSELSWTGGKNNYDALLGFARTKAGSGITVLHASPDSIFADEPAGKLGVTLASLTRRYFVVDDVGTSPTWECVRRAAGYRTSDANIAPTCPKLSWPGAPKTDVCLSTPKDSLPSENFVCGDKDDLAVALGGAQPSRFWLTRWEASAALTTDTKLTTDLPVSLPAFHEAANLDRLGCDTPIGTEDAGATDTGSGAGFDSGAGGGSGGGGGAGGGGGSGGGGGYPSYDNPPDDNTGCNSSGSSCNSSSGDSCNSSDGSGCGSGDSSGCGSGDSDGCSSSDGGGCDGSDAGDACSGSSGSGCGKDCTMSRARPKRATPFFWLAIAAFAVVRRKRRPRL